MVKLAQYNVLYQISEEMIIFSALQQKKLQKE